MLGQDRPNPCGAHAQVGVQWQSQIDQTRERLFGWRATLIKGTPARYLSSVDAPDEETVREQAAKEFNVREVLKVRIAVQREG
jgi:hypothetical protein